VLEQRLEPGPAVVPGHPLLRDRHADRVAHALAERAGRGLDAGGVLVLGVPGGLAVELAEVLELLEGQRRLVVDLAVLVDVLDAGEVDERVQEHRGVAVGEHEPVAVRPQRVRRVVVQEPVPHGVRDRGQAHRRARVPGVGLLNGVHGQRADGVDARDVKRGELAHGCLAGCDGVRSGK
jgi:hypothetical protein